MRLLMALLGACAALAVRADDPSSLSLQIHHTPAGLTIVGSIGSVAHESILRDTLRRHFGAEAADATRFQLERAASPPGWALVTDITLQSLSHTQSATAEISTSTVRVSGVTSSGTEWREAAGRIERSLMQGMNLVDEVVVVQPITDFADACRRQLRDLGASRRVEFTATSPAIRPSSLAMLDAIAELSADCSAFVLRITGHTDATGPEGENRRLSLARAQAVATYLESRGVPPSRMLPEGRGSERPIAEGTSRRARRLNRRVEFEFLDAGTP